MDLQQASFIYAEESCLCWSMSIQGCSILVGAHRCGWIDHILSCSMNSKFTCKFFRGDKINYFLDCSLKLSQFICHLMFHFFTNKLKQFYLFWNFLWGTLSCKYAIDGSFNQLKWCHGNQWKKFNRIQFLIMEPILMTWYFYRRWRRLATCGPFCYRYLADLSYYL